MDRRASLSLSINAIVVLILAITILGLSLLFIRTQWKTVGTQFEDTQQEIEKQLVDKIRNSNELLAFNKESISTVRGVESRFYIGISNTEAVDRCFKILFKCVQPRTPGTNCYNGVDNVQVGGNFPSLPTPGYTVTASAANWFKVFSDVIIKQQDVGVYPVYLQIGTAAQDSYLMEVDIFKSATGSDCAGNFDLAPYQSKQFYIEVR
jgi:hypothetical protein